MGSQDIFPFLRHISHFCPKSEDGQAAILPSHDLRKFPIDDLRHHALHIPVAVNAVQREPGGKLFHLFKGRGGINMDLTADESIHLIERIFPALKGASEADWGLCSCLQHGKAA